MTMDLEKNPSIPPVPEEPEDNKKPEASPDDSGNHGTVDEQWARELHMPPPVPRQERQEPPQIPPVPPRPENPRQEATPQQSRQPLPEEEPPMPPTYLVWSILCCVCCCLIPGIVAAFYSAKVSGRYYNGDYEGARKASRMTEIWIIVSFVLGLVMTSIYLPITLFSQQ